MNADRKRMKEFGGRGTLVRLLLPRPPRVDLERGWPVDVDAIGCWPSGLVGEGEYDEWSRVVVG